MLRPYGLLVFCVLAPAAAGAQVRFVAPVAPVVPATPRLLLPAPVLTPALPHLTPAPPRLTPALPGAAPVVPALGAGAEVAPPAASKAELDFAADASARVALLADDIAAEAGYRSSRMSGADFTAVVAEAAAREDAAAAPTPQAQAAAVRVRAALLRVVRALLRPEQPLNTQVRRLLSVWQVFNEEMSRAAAEKGSLEGVAAEAELFAEQVERSV
ncbi:MAG: hypothetical protein HYV15_02305 [Elusimicrobia bacterium]|nr:hypothetical protein [Elusimicrobiota bacterium]